MFLRKIAASSVFLHTIHKEFSHGFGDQNDPTGYFNCNRPNMTTGQNATARGNFREAIWPILLVGQVFGVMPMIGVRGRKISVLCFKWQSVRTIYSVFIAIVLVSYSILVTLNTFQNDIQLSSVCKYNSKKLNSTHHRLC